MHRWRDIESGKTKVTQICQSCARLKNCCQACLLDLDYGMAVNVRDMALMKAGVGVNQLAEHDKNITWQQDAVDNGRAGSLNYESLDPATLLLNIARNNPMVRPVVKKTVEEKEICPLWVKGCCAKGDKCPMRHAFQAGRESAAENVDAAEEKAVEKEEEPQYPHSRGLKRVKYAALDPANF